MPSQEELRELFEYKDGSLIRRSTGQVVGFRKSYGYKAVSCRGKHQLVHRIIWVMHHGQIPRDRVIDHIDRDRLNNRIENLRLFTFSENMRNRSTYPRRRSDIRGVTWNRPANSWRAIIKVDGALIYLGDFQDLQKAVAARRAGEDKYFIPRMLQ
jgi:hypothetical protein